MQRSRYYQRKAQAAVEFGWEEYWRTVMQMPTGSGKTHVIAKVFQAMQPGRCLLLADQDELVQQPRSVIQQATGIIPAIHKAKERPSLQAQIVIGSSQTMARESKKGSGIYRHLEHYPRNHFDYIISDEVHRGTDRDQKVWEYFDTARVCGVTATPFRSNLADLSKWFEKVVYRMSIMDMVEEGFAPRPNWITLPVEIDLEQLKTKRGVEGKDYDLESVDSVIAPYYLQIAELVKEHAQGRHGIAYLPLIRSSQAFAAILRSIGIRAYHVDGESDNRDALIHAFADGQIDWLCNASLLSTGVDMPRADCFLNLRLTQSRSWYQQARGRVMRVLPGVVDHLPEKEQAAERRALIAASAKPDFMLLDLLLQNDKLGTPHAADDFAANEYDAKTLFERSKKERSPLDIIEMAKRVQAEREAALVAALERAAIRSSLHSPMTGPQIAALLGIAELIDYIPVQRWEQEPPTSRQLDLLREKGVDTSSIKSKGMASQLLETFFDRYKLGYASMKQVKIIKQADEFKPPHERTPNPERLSVEDASLIIDRLYKARRRAAA